MDTRPTTNHRAAITITDLRHVTTSSYLRCRCSNMYLSKLTVVNVESETPNRRRQRRRYVALLGQNKAGLSSITAILNVMNTGWRMLPTAKSDRAKPNSNMLEAVCREGVFQMAAINKAFPIVATRENGMFKMQLIKSSEGSTLWVRLKSWFMSEQRNVSSVDSLVPFSFVHGLDMAYLGLDPL